MSLADYLLGASDPNNPNQTIQTPDQIARRQMLADALMKQGNDYSPIASPWQGAARLVDALNGGLQNARANREQNLGQANAQAQWGNLLGMDPGSQNINATPGRTTADLGMSDARSDALQDAGDTAPAAAPASQGQRLAAALGQSSGGYDYAMPTNGANTAGLNPAFADRIQDLQQDAQDAGVGSTLISGYRDATKQAHLYANYLARRSGEPIPYPNEGGGGLAAPPGASYHNYGNAADIVTNNPGQQGQLTAMASEPWRGIYPGANFGDADHYQIAGPINAGGAPASAIAAQPAPMSGSLAAYAAAKDAAQGAPAVAAINAAAPAPGQAASTPSPAGGAALPSPADFSQLRTAMTAPSAAAPAAAPSPSAAAPPAAMPTGPGGLHPDLQTAMRIISNPYATPAMQQVAQALISAQMPTPPEFKTVKDASGADIPYAWYPKTGQLVPIGSGGGGISGPLTMPPSAGQGASAAPVTAAGAMPAPASIGGPPAAAGAAPPAPTLDKTIPAQPVAGESNIDALVAANPAYAPYATTAKAVLRGQQPAPVTGTGQKDPKDLAIMKLVYAANPQFDATMYDQRKKALEGANDGSTPNSTGGMITNLQTAIRHLGTFAQASEDLGKYQFRTQALNEGPFGFGYDWGAKQFNSTGEHSQALSRFEAAKGEFVMEATKFLSGGQGSDSARASLATAVDEHAPPEARRAALQTFAKLMADKSDVLRNRLSTGVNSNAAPYETIDPQTQQTLNYVLSLGGGAPSAAGAQQPGAPMGVGESRQVNGVTIRRVN